MSFNDYSTIEERAQVLRDAGFTDEPPSEAAPLEAVCATDVDVRPIEWTWQKVVVRNALNAWQGLAGIGKTFLLCAYVAARSKGGYVQGVSGDMEQLQRGRVLFLTGDDDIETTIVPRLIALEAALSNIFFAPEGTCPPIGSPDFDQLVDHCNPDDIILDTLQHFTPPRVDLNSANATTAAFLPLKIMAQKGRTVIVIQYISKQSASGSGGHSVNFGIGSSAINGLFRSVWTLGRLRDDNGKPSTVRVLAPSKANLVAGDPHAVRFELTEERGFTWAGIDRDITAEDLYNLFAKKGRATPERDECAAYLLDLLAAGPMPANEAKEGAEASGFSEATINRAKKTAGVTTYKEKGKHGKWVWALKDYQVDSLKKRDNVDSLDNLTSKDYQHYQDYHLNLLDKADNLTEIANVNITNAFVELDDVDGLPWED